jgi:hypothetical protein
VIPVRFTATAAAQIAARRKWWRENRDKAPDLFDREYDDAIEDLGRRAGSLPVFASEGGHAIRRYLMVRTRCHLYFEVIETPAEIRVLAAGGGQRKRPPRMRLHDAP